MAALERGQSVSTVFYIELKAMPGRAEPSRKETETVWGKVEKSRRKSGLETWNKPCRTGQLDEARGGLENRRSRAEQTLMWANNRQGIRSGQKWVEADKNAEKWGKNDDANWRWASLDISDNFFDFGQSASSASGRLHQEGSKFLPLNWCEDLWSMMWKVRSIIRSYFKTDSL